MGDFDAERNCDAGQIGGILPALPPCLRRGVAPHSVTSPPARAATIASAVPNAPAPATATLRKPSACAVAERRHRRLASSSGQRRAGRGRRRSRPGQALGAGPGDHRGIVGAERRRRRGETAAGARSQFAGGRRWRGWRRRRRRPPARSCLPVCSRNMRSAGARGRPRCRRPPPLEGGAEVGDILSRDGALLLGLQPQGRLQAGEGEIGAVAPLHRARQSEARGIAASWPRCSTCGPPG